MARPVCLCEDTGVIGTMFYIMSYVAGRNFWDPSLPGMTPLQRAAIYDEMNRVLVQLHTLDFAAAGLADYGKPGNYFARQIGRWSKQYRASETERIESMEKLLAWLPANIPPGDETTLVHGDYRIDNMIFHSHDPQVAAVVDWELSTLGHPLADLSYHVMLWRVEAGEIRGLRGLDLPALGIPTEAAVRRDLLPPHRARRHRAARVGVLHGLQPVPHRLHPPGDPAPRGRRHRRQPPCARSRRAGARDRRPCLAADPGDSSAARARRSLRSSPVRAAKRQPALVRTTMSR